MPAIIHHIATFMATNKLRFAVFGNTYQSKKSASIQRLMSCLSSYGCGISVDKAYYDFITSTVGLSVGGAEVFEGDDFDADFVISVGGDGTFLKAASRVGTKGIPILGVNVGRLGFLADVAPDEIETCIEQLHKGEYTVEQRKTIQVDVPGFKFSAPPFALNDVSILKRDNASMISIRAAVNGEYLTTYQADGLIVSTPTGSTAYSLSNGGPIIVPGTNVFLMTAVAPHSLNMRPIVMHDNVVLTLDVESRNHNFLIAIDGHSEKCSEGTRITLCKAPYKVNVVKRMGQTYSQVLRQKMMWGADGRG